MNENDASSDKSLFAVRQAIFLLLRTRLRALHKSRPPSERHSIWQYYSDDENRINCIIAANFLIPGRIKPINFWMNGTKVHGAVYGNALLIRAYRRIPMKLWDDLRLAGEGQNFIVGYINTLMPVINHHLIEGRYTEGHLLARTFAIFEAIDVSVTADGTRIWLDWPLSVPSFPPSAQLSETGTTLYVRDLIDAMHAFFRNDYDDCVRRIVTSIENLIETNNWKARSSYLPTTQERGSSFRSRLEDNVNLDIISGDTINYNLQFVYTIRNKIVHDGHRMDVGSLLFCDKAIGSLYYLIQRYSGDINISRYAYTLHQQFTLLKSMLGQLRDLDELAKIFRRPPIDSKPIDNKDDLEHFVFAALRFTGNDKRKALRSRLKG